MEPVRYHHDTRDWVLNAADEVAVQRGCVMDLERAAWVIDWIENNCRLYEGELAGEYIKLMPFQKQFVVKLFGWVQYSPFYARWVRRFKTARLWCSKKNGKTPFMAAIQLYLLSADGEQGQKVYTAAKDSTQAGIAQEQAIQMVKQMPLWEQDYKIWHNTKMIRHLTSNSFMSVVSSSNERTTKTKEGYNGTVCYDELHVVDESLAGRLKYAGRSRAQALNLAVSTSGFEMDGFGKREFDHGRLVNSGKMEPAKQDIQFLHEEYAVPDGVTDEMLDKNFMHYAKMANPALGLILSEETLRNDYVQARSRPTEWHKFKVYSFTMWCNSVTQWIQSDQWAKCGESYTWDDLKGRDCYAGIDLAGVKDMASLVLCFPWKDANNKPYVRLWPFFWLPQDRVQTLCGNYPQMREWVAKKLLFTTPDNRVSAQELKNHFRRIFKEVKVKAMIYDPYKAEDITVDLIEGERDAENPRKVLYPPMACKRHPIGQSRTRMNEPCQMFESGLLGCEIRHPNHDVLTWQASHAEVEIDNDKNIKPSKPDGQEYTGKSIDGIVASVLASYGAKVLRVADPRVRVMG
jgi:phage terminase large subunit-like protein